MNERKLEKGSGRKKLNLICHLVFVFKSWVKLLLFHFVKFSSFLSILYRCGGNEKRNLHCHLPIQHGNFIKENVFVNEEFKELISVIVFLGCFECFILTLLILSAHP